MQAQKELNESTSQFLKDAMPFEEPSNRHERRANDKADRLADKKAKKFLAAIANLDSSY